MNTDNLNTLKGFTAADLYVGSVVRDAYGVDIVITHITRKIDPLLKTPTSMLRIDGVTVVDNQVIRTAREWLAGASVTILV